MKRFNTFNESDHLYRNACISHDFSRMSERSSQPRMSQETRDSLLRLDSIIDEILSRDIIIKIPKPVDKTRERDPEILVYGAMLAKAEINGLTIQCGHVIGRDVIDASLLSLAAK
jgi:hypothetical protein